MRVSRKQVDERAELVSSLLRGPLEVRAQGRYGYLGLDLYDERGAVRTLSTGLSTRQAYEYLGAMLETLDIIGRPSS